MLWNNLKIALRSLRKHKLFAFINIAGLALGMTIYVLGGLTVSYERTHDLFFENSDRIYTVGAYAAPELNVGIDQLNATFSAVGPIIDSELADVEAVARTLRYEFLVTMADDSFPHCSKFSTSSTSAAGPMRSRARPAWSSPRRPPSSTSGARTWSGRSSRWTTNTSSR